MTVPTNSTAFNVFSANLERVHLLSVDPDASSRSVAYAALGLLAVFVVLGWVLFILWRRRQVHAASAALQHLAEVNSRYRGTFLTLPPVRLSFDRAVNSKAKFDRFDLAALMSLSILENESWVEIEVRRRLSSIETYEEYRNETEAVARRRLGISSHPRVNVKSFVAIEEKMFRRRILKGPVPKARFSATVKYTSPKGQNSYLRRLDWDFNQLRDGLRAAQAARALQSTAEFQRKRERSLMTPSLRMTILRRDGHRCQMCGAAASSGAVLHIDHITPVSLGGLTNMQNLQTLCEPCNLGKSNRFVG